MARHDREESLEEQLAWLDAIKESAETPVAVSATAEPAASAPAEAGASPYPADPWLAVPAQVETPSFRAAVDSVYGTGTAVEEEAAAPQTEASEYVEAETEPNARGIKLSWPKAPDWPKPDADFSAFAPETDGEPFHAFGRPDAEAPEEVPQEAEKAYRESEEALRRAEEVLRKAEQPFALPDKPFSAPESLFGRSDAPFAPVAEPYERAGNPFDQVTDKPSAKPFADADFATEETFTPPFSAEKPPMPDLGKPSDRAFDLDPPSAAERAAPDPGDRRAPDKSPDVATPFSAEKPFSMDLPLPGEKPAPASGSDSGSGSGSASALGSASASASVENPLTSDRPSLPDVRPSSPDVRLAASDVRSSAPEMRSPASEVRPAAPERRSSAPSLSPEPRVESRMEVRRRPAPVPVFPAPPRPPITGRPNVDSLDPESLLRGRRNAPSKGWRRLVYKASGGWIKPGEPAEVRRRRELLSRARTPVATGHHRVAVLSLKGGVGKTTTTVGLGATLAQVRGDRVIAVDANPDRGTLSDKLELETSATVRDLLNERDQVKRYVDIRAFTSQAPSRLEVLASDRDPSVSEAFSGTDYQAASQVLENFYSICITDCGTGLLHSAMGGVLGLADQIVLVSSPSVDGARAASATLDWLEAHDYGDLVRDATVVLCSVRPRSKSAVDIGKLEAHFAARCRAVVQVPYDPHLDEGAEIDLDRLQEATRESYLQLAAYVGDGFAGHFTDE
ncbi:MinD/ParA family ATP-binding protein [Nonomuraea longicatena]|uniref:CobQ/CobB/MinD/ParA nucleotide binding domain-containing protein n=1 Tax=Nonomuraea longicatena TaxID=83682 RepID=A0ABN1R8I1_9ACTN